MTASTFNPAYATAAETVSALRAKKISASELVNLTLQRIDHYNPKLNAICWQDRERATARAREADEALARGTAAGALHGVPITIKESFAYRGSPNTWGLPALKDTTSPRTAVAIERLESGGAIVVGKTNVPVMLGDWQTYNSIYGTTNNPWDLRRTPGGSTGGGSAALAAGFGCLSMGTDLSGSIRRDNVRTQTWLRGTATRRWPACPPRWRQWEGPVRVCLSASKSSRQCGRTPRRLSLPPALRT